MNENFNGKDNTFDAIYHWIGYYEYSSYTPWAGYHENSESGAPFQYEDRLSHEWDFFILRALLSGQVLSNWYPHTKQFLSSKNGKKKLVYSKW